MATTIGGVTCNYLHGSVGALGTLLELYRPVGRNGVGAQDLGKGPGEWAFEAVLYGSVSTTDTWVASLKALQGTVVTAVDDLAVTRANLLVVSVGPPQRAPARGYAADAPADAVRVVVAMGGVVTK
ncbi:MAG: hypothetical protein IMZ66_05040 [Planctomycetes bacterium]|nr:hypothetical protein [Planctomycetota bacterium]